VEDRKVRKLVKRTDLLGLYAAGRAIDDAGLIAYRGTLAPGDAAAFNDRTGVYVGAGVDGYQNLYEFFPLFSAANGDLGNIRPGTRRYGGIHVALRSLPNNVLCHIGIRYGFEGAQMPAW